MHFISTIKFVIANVVFEVKMRRVERMLDKIDITLDALEADLNTAIEFISCEQLPSIVRHQSSRSPSQDRQTIWTQLPPGAIF